LIKTNFWASIWPVGLYILLEKSIWQPLIDVAHIKPGASKRKHPHMKQGNSALKTMMSVLSFVVAFVAVKYGIEFLVERQAIAEVDVLAEKLRVDGVKKHPELAPSEAAGVEGVEYLAKKLESETDENKKMQLAAYGFLGFYFVNTNERSAFCSGLGVSITPFTVAFERLHDRELARTKEIRTEMRIQEQKVLAMLKPHFRKTIIEDMAELSSSLNMPVNEVCRFFTENGEALAQEMHISKVNPAVYTALKGGQ
jgi:hypothetical protein